MCAHTFLMRSGFFIMASILTRAMTSDCCFLVKPASLAIASNSSLITSWLTWSSTGTGSKFKGNVAPSLMESAKEYLLIYPDLSSTAPKAWKVFLSRLLIGVPVKPKKKALGRAVLIFSPRLPSWVLWASSTISMMLSLAFKHPLTSLNLNMVVIIIFLASPLSSCSSLSPELAFSRLGMSEALNVAVICVSRSMRSSTMITVGLFNCFVILSFWAAKTISNDLPLPWKCHMRPCLGNPLTTRSTIMLAPSNCW